MYIETPTRKESNQMLLLNAFSLNMLDVTAVATVSVQPVSVGEARDILANGVESAIGHTDTAAVVGEVLGIVVPANRANVRLVSGSQALVAQYVGPRLPEGTTCLPEGARIDFVHITIS